MYSPTISPDSHPIFGSRRQTPQRRLLELLVAGAVIAGVVGLAHHQDAALLAKVFLDPLLYSSSTVNLVLLCGALAATLGVTALQGVGPSRAEALHSSPLDRQLWLALLAGGLVGLHAYLDYRSAWLLPGGTAYHFDTRALSASGLFDNRLGLGALSHFDSAGTLLGVEQMATSPFATHLAGWQVIALVGAAAVASLAGLLRSADLLIAWRGRRGLALAYLLAWLNCVIGLFDGGLLAYPFVLSFGILVALPGFVASPGSRWRLLSVLVLGNLVYLTTWSGLSATFSGSGLRGYLALLAVYVALIGIGLGGIAGRSLGGLAVTYLLLVWSYQYDQGVGQLLAPAAASSRLVDDNGAILATPRPGATLASLYRQAGEDPLAPQAAFVVDSDPANRRDDDRYRALFEVVPISMTAERDPVMPSQSAHRVELASDGERLFARVSSPPGQLPPIYTHRASFISQHNQRVHLLAIGRQLRQHGLHEFVLIPRTQPGADTPALAAD